MLNPFLQYWSIYGRMCLILFIATQSVHDGRIYTLAIVCGRDYPDRVSPDLYFPVSLEFTCLNSLWLVIHLKGNTSTTHQFRFRFQDSN